jgi:predicted transcriptional regulator
MSREATAPDDLSRRERQLMDALYKVGEASAAELREAIPNPPTLTAVRTLLTILETKGHVAHRQEGVKYIFRPVASRESVAKEAINRVVDTFFQGSVERVVASLVDAKESTLTNQDLDRLQELIAEARRQGR